MSALSELINDLNRQIKKKDKRLACIQDPEGLVDALEELEDIVGMDKLKNSITRQTRYLIAKLEEGKRSVKMLNTVLYGDPGMGKTTVGVLMARIWSNLGFLKGSKKSEDESESILDSDNIVSFNKITELADDPDILKLLIFGSIFMGTTVWSIIKWCYNSFGLILLIVLIAFCWIIIFIIWRYYNYDYTQEDVVINIQETNNEDNTKDKKSKKYKRSKRKRKEDIIKIASRTDFVDKYVGWTDKKTEKLLNESRGKVLFIDEAYSLCLNARDQYGMEAITYLNKFMSENPDEIIVIFAGYEHLMKNGIFEIQPGLPRRCMWHINCDPYNGEQLTEIYIRQLAREDLKIYDNEFSDIQTLIVDNINAFPSYGGDTERLVFFSQLHQADRNDREIGFISYQDIKLGIKDLRDNNITKPNNNNNNPSKATGYDPSSYFEDNPELFSNLIQSYRQQNGIQS